MRERSLTVSQLCTYVKGVFEDELILHNLCVVGEVSAFKQTASATFLTLKDENSALQCVCFESIEPLTEGEKVSLLGSVRFYDRSGKVSFLFKSFTRIGKGALLAQLYALRDRLAQEGVFDRKKPIPAPIKDIGVITGETGVVIHDFIKTLWRKRKMGIVRIYPVAVQGKTAAEEIVHALKKADKAGHDLLCVMRGGGSEEDLSTFNDETLVRTVSQCKTPVLSAVGHETDVMLCDFAASVRAGTPSMAGEWIADQNDAYIESIRAYGVKLLQSMERLRAKRINTLYRTAASLSFKSEQKFDRVRYVLNRSANRLSDRADKVWREKRSAVSAFGSRLCTRTEQKLASVQTRVGELSGSLQKNSPLRILSMGYAKLFKSDGTGADVTNTEIGEEIRAVTANGSMTATVTNILSKGER
ncbi:MAG: exodeoxyribonuclease VII large subunit [Clostridiales bacterium]|nr:exodeoxyribonuclease VII large subunit [Clostridiales bacterium]